MMTLMPRVELLQGLLRYTRMTGASRQDISDKLGITLDESSELTAFCLMRCMVRFTIMGGITIFSATDFGIHLLDNPGELAKEIENS